MQIIQWNEFSFEQNEIRINTLIENEIGKEIQILMPENSIMKEHKTPFAIYVQVLSGKIIFEVQNEKIELKFLDMIRLEPNISHSLSALENSIIRLSLNKLDNIQRVNTIFKKF